MTEDEYISGFSLGLIIFMILGIFFMIGFGTYLLMGMEDRKENPRLVEISKMVTLSENCIKDLKTSDEVMPDGITACNKTINMMENWNPDNLFKLSDVLTAKQFEHYIVLLYKLKGNVRIIKKIINEEFLTGT